MPKMIGTVDLELGVADELAVDVELAAPAGAPAA